MGESTIRHNFSLSCLYFKIQIVFERVRFYLADETILADN